MGTIPPMLRELHTELGIPDDFPVTVDLKNMHLISAVEDKNFKPVEVPAPAKTPAKKKKKTATK